MADLMKAVSLSVQSWRAALCHSRQATAGQKKKKRKAKGGGEERRAVLSVVPRLRLGLLLLAGVPLFRRTAVKSRPRGGMGDTLQLLWGRDLGSFGETQTGFDLRRQGGWFKVLSVGGRGKASQWRRQAMNNRQVSR